MENFIITFGQNHAHRANNTTFDKDCVAVIKAETHGKARRIASDLFGMRFGTSYTEKEFDDGNMIEWFPNGKKAAN